MNLIIHLLQWLSYCTSPVWFLWIQKLLQWVSNIVLMCLFLRWVTNKYKCHRRIRQITANTTLLLCLHKGLSMCITWYFLRCDTFLVSCLFPYRLWTPGDGGGGKKCIFLVPSTGLKYSRWFCWRDERVKEDLYKKTILRENDS